jgi:hypothetical protein
MFGGAPLSVIVLVIVSVLVPVVMSCFRRDNSKFKVGFSRVDVGAPVSAVPVVDAIHEKRVDL